MAGIDHAPPPFFKRGPAPLALLIFYCALSLALVVLDLKFHSLEILRQVAQTLVYPVQRLAQSPAVVLGSFSDYIISVKTIQAENESLHQRELEVAASNLRVASLEAENARLRQLLDLQEREKGRGIVATILYAARDPFSRKIVVDRGVENDITPGLPVISEQGVIGQVTRVFPFGSEVTLVTDKNQVVPVKILRTGQRSVVFGLGNGQLELRYLPSNVDVVEGDMLVTSGIDGVYLGGFPVARVERIERETAYAFARIICTPVTGAESHGEVVILRPRTKLAERPPEPTPITPKSRRHR
jgi:rod shape-determining protein MreC